MASAKTQLNEFYVDSTTTTPVLLGDHRVGVDYILKRVHTTGAHVSIGNFVAFETNDMDEVEYSASDTAPNAIVPDTPFNRRQISIHNTTTVVADWSYTLIFADETEIEIVIPINNLIVRAVWAASSGNINLTTALEIASVGKVKVQAAGGRAIGHPLCTIADGTGDQVIPMVFYGCAISETLKA